MQARIFEGPDADGLTDRQRALITATDEFVDHPDDVDARPGPPWPPSRPAATHRILHCWQGNTTRLAATMATLTIPLDFPD